LSAQLPIPASTKVRAARRKRVIESIVARVGPRIQGEWVDQKTTKRSQDRDPHGCPVPSVMGFAVSGGAAGRWSVIQCSA
jgi:hypothetical protein